MFEQEVTVEKVEILYKGFGDNRKTIGVTITAKFEVIDEEYEVKIGVPSTIPSPTVGDTINITIG